MSIYLGANCCVACIKFSWQMFKNVCVVEIFSFHSNNKKNEYVFPRSISRTVCFVGISYVYDLRAGCFSYIIFIYSICVGTNVYGAFTKSSSSI